MCKKLKKTVIVLLSKQVLREVNIIKDKPFLRQFGVRLLKKVTIKKKGDPDKSEWAHSGTK